MGFPIMPKPMKPTFPMLFLTTKSEGVVVAMGEGGQQ